MLVLVGLLLIGGLSSLLFVQSLERQRAVAGRVLAADLEQHQRQLEDTFQWLEGALALIASQPLDGLSEQAGASPQDARDDDSAAARAYPLTSLLALAKAMMTANTEIQSVRVTPLSHTADPMPTGPVTELGREGLNEIVRLTVPTSTKEAWQDVPLAELDTGPHYRLDPDPATAPTQATGQHSVSVLGTIAVRDGAGRPHAIVNLLVSMPWRTERDEEGLNAGVEGAMTTLVLIPKSAGSERQDTQVQTVMREQVAYVALSRRFVFPRSQPFELWVMMPEAVVTARAWQTVRNDLVVLWLLGLGLLGVMTIALFRWRYGRFNVEVSNRVDARHRFVRVLGVELSLPNARSVSAASVIIALLLPVLFWAGLTLLFGQPIRHPYIFMLLPVLLAAWLGGLLSGLAASLLATVLVFDLKTAGIFQWQDGQDFDLWAAIALLTTGVLASFVIESVRRHGSTMASQQQSQRDIERRLLEQAPTGLAMLDNDQRVVAASTSWKLLHRLPAHSDVVGQRYRDFIPKPSEYWQSVFKQMRTQGFFSVYEQPYQLIDGSTVWVNGQCKPWKHADGTVGGVILVIEDVTRSVSQRQRLEQVRHRAEQEKIETLKHASMLERRLLEAADSEQQRIGRDLHDSLGPQLASIAYAASFLASELRVQNPPMAEKADQLGSMIRDAISQTRDLARGISPLKIDAEGLSHSLDDYAKTLSNNHDVEVSYIETGDAVRLDPEQASHLFQIAREAVNNALKHGACRHVTIGLHRNPDSLRLTVADDGRGMALDTAVGTGIGLESMAYRAKAIGGELHIDSSPDEGTIITCEILYSRLADETPTTP